MNSVLQRCLLLLLLLLFACVLVMRKLEWLRVHDLTQAAAVECHASYRQQPGEWGETNLWLFSKQDDSLPTRHGGACRLAVQSMFRQYVTCWIWITWLAFFQMRLSITGRRFVNGFNKLCNTHVSCA